MIEETEATGEVKRIFEEIKALLGLPFVPQLFRALADRPPELASTWERLKNVMVAGEVDVRTKSVAAFSAACAKDNAYFISAYGAALKRLGLTQHEIEELKRVVELTVELADKAQQLHLKPDLEGA